MWVVGRLGRGGGLSIVRILGVLVGCGLLVPCGGMG